MEDIRVNIWAPDLICICVDGKTMGDGWGRLYCCYSKEEIPFENEHRLLVIIGELLDAINYPQASTQIRSFGEEPEKTKKETFVKVKEGRDVVGHSGKMCTFIVYIQYRQNATWQGEVSWVEKGKSMKFRSALELLKLIDNAMYAIEPENRTDV